MSDEMIKALGELVTEIGDVEYVMFETIIAVSKDDANEVHRRFYSKPFGPKVEMLEDELKHSAFDDHRTDLNSLVQMLRKLTLQRNNIIHGETFYITRKGESKVFRVGFTRGRPPPWRDFKFEGNGENIFTSNQVDEVVDVCIAIKTDLDLIRQKVIETLTGVRPPYLSHIFEID